MLLAGVLIFLGVFGDPMGCKVVLITGLDGWLEVNRPTLGKAAGAGDLGIVFAILNARTA